MKNKMSRFNIYYLDIYLWKLTLNQYLLIRDMNNKSGGGKMKVYTALLLQLIIWSGYTFIEWLSKYDQFIFKVLMFFVFLYLAIIIGNYIVKSVKKTFFVTALSLSLYGSFHFTMTLMGA